MNRTVRRLLSALCAAALFFAIGALLNFLLNDDVESHTRIMFHDLYAAPQNIDVAYVGSSHAKRSFDPRVIDPALGKYSFNAGSAMQRLSGSFAMIREICAYNQPETIFLELYYGSALDKDSRHYSMTPTFILSDYMRLSPRKLDFLRRAVPRRHLVNCLLPARREWRSWMDLNAMAELAQRKLTDPYYRNYRWDPENNDEEYYVGQGFFTDDSPYAGALVWNDKACNPIAEDYQADEAWVRDSLNEIIDFCEKRGVELVMVVTPEPEATVAGVGDYPRYHALLQSIADARGVELLDFNLCRYECFDANDLTFFRDEDHLNTVGAAAFSALLCDYRLGRISREALFFDSLEEKLASEPPRVYGLAGPLEDEDAGVRRAHVNSNRDEGLEYRVVARPSGGGERVLIDFTGEKWFETPLEEHGTFAVTWRLAGQPETEQSFEAWY